MSATIVQRQFRGRSFDFRLALKDGQTLIAEVPAEAAPAWPADQETVRIEFGKQALVPIPGG